MGEALNYFYLDQKRSTPLKQISSIDSFGMESSRTDFHKNSKKNISYPHHQRTTFEQQGFNLKFTNRKIIGNRSTIEAKFHRFYNLLKN
ncbi:hypothetical protein DQM68_03250 [Leptospira mayottensis]|uniref:Uncharacterized protein n=2 Tax=Leptospira mayottensis TaxID=1137606 RepID=A0AA87MM53_9LEPT|nr:hypothetical protein DQM68_03250 [Leptospira mayottensis]AXR63880.1 hypothetical protein DQM28_06205 [Leptospira mayottensis]AZQ00804.1 hypothetical protein LEP1GSC190_00705 [Leptospira mayottensis 200901116]EKR99949.1 hypothetical protein LEP1GSC125_3148 [Leptospira mayottensis 200901122]TGN09077.1 hypothetical protein EHR03_08880 [Leptospira mayottensis]